MYRKYINGDTITEITLAKVAETPANLVKMKLFQKYTPPFQIQK